MERLSQESPSEILEIKEKGNFCGICGGHVNIGDNFCGKCGKSLKEQQEFKDNYAECLELLFQNDNDSNDISVDIQPDLKSAKIKVVLRPDELGKDFFPENFSISVDIVIKSVNASDYIVKIIKEEHNIELKKIFKFEEAHFKIGEREFDLIQFCPKEISVFLCPAISTSNFRDPNNDGLGGDVIMEDFSSPMDLIGLLHEIGHDIEQSRKDRVERRRSNIELSDLERKPLFEHARYLEAKARSERDAWAEAIKISRKSNMGLDSVIKRCAQVSLATYQRKEDKLYNEGVIHDTSTGFTNEKKKEIRDQKIFCPNCQHFNENSYTFCRICGSCLPS